MKNWIIVLITFLLIVSSAFSSEFDIEINPKEPIINEPFQVIFKIKTNSSEEPDISFNPQGAEVVGRQDQGLSIKTMFINGRLVTSKEMIFSYELVSSRTGTIRLSDIKVDVSGETLTKPPININILKEPKQLPPFFAHAITDKSSVFVGEGFTVRYYLYFKAGVVSTDIKEFPKLNKFFKRFLQENLNPERVEFEGEVYTRNLVYSARLFPEKDGKFFVDPITLRVQYHERSSQDPFAALGFGFRSGPLKNKMSSSKPIEITVEKLPAENVPPHFTGLVGKHQFDLNITKSKYLVNEPIELKFSASGPGYLENFDAPKLFNNEKFEEFETNSDLKIETDISAKKVFDYTYIGRSSVDQKETTIPLSYFNPETKQYVTVNLNLGAITISGESTFVPKKDETNEDQNSSKTTIEDIKSKVLPKKLDEKIQILAPEFSFKEGILRSANFIIYILVFIFLVQIFLLLRKKAVISGLELENVIKRIFKKGLSIQRFYEFLNLVSNEVLNSPFSNINKLFENIKTSDEVKKYFYDLNEKLENKEYFNKKDNSEIKINERYFYEIVKAVRLKKDEDL